MSPVPSTVHMVLVQLGFWPIKPWHSLLFQEEITSMQCTAEYGVTGKPFDKELDVLNWHPGSLYNILLSLSIHLENGMIQVL